MGLRYAITAVAAVYLAMSLAGCNGSSGYPEVRPATKPLPRLKIAQNGRYLTTAHGAPFFWLADTAWRLIQRSSLVDAFNQPAVVRYFAARRAQGFNVILTVAARSGGVRNAAGQPAFVAGDFNRPDIIEGPANDYWDYCDAIIDLVRAHGMYAALLPLWLNEIEKGHPMERDPSIAYRYGRFLGERYRDRAHIIWIMGGDPHREGRDVDRPERLRMVRALAEGIADGTNGTGGYDHQADWSSTLMSFHPRGGGHSSSEYLHAEPWLDFNMIQTTSRFNFTNYETVTADLAKKPPKPTIDSEVAYEYSLSLRSVESCDGRIGPWEVRRAAYWSVFAGSFGHTYGHRSFIRWTCRGERHKFGADIPWYEMLDSPGAAQMKHLFRIMDTIGFSKAVPCQDLLANGPGDGVDHTQAMLYDAGQGALVYLPTGKAVDVRMEEIGGSRAEIIWFDPRNGVKNRDGLVETAGIRHFNPPTSGAGQDWVLIILSAPPV